MDTVHKSAVEFIHKIVPQLKETVDYIFLDECGNQSKAMFAQDAVRGIRSWIQSIEDTRIYMRADLKRIEKVESRLRKISRVISHIVTNKYVNQNVVSLLSEIKDEAESYLVMIQMLRVV